MGNELSSAIMAYDDVLILILERLEVRDQLSMIKCTKSFQVILVKYIWTRGLTVDTDVIEDNNHFKQLMLQHGRTFRRLNVGGGIDNFNWNSLRSLGELTVVSLKNVNLNVHYLYNMVRTLVNLESLVLQSINFDSQITAFYNHNPIKYDFKVKSLKKLQVQFNTQLCSLIENCINLEELSIGNILERQLIWLNNSLIEKAEINSKIYGFINNACKAFASDITFGIHLKKGQPADVFVMHNSGIHFETIKQAKERLNNMDGNQKLDPFKLVLLPEIDKQLRSFEFERNYLKSAVNLDNIIYSKYLHITNCCLSSKQFIVILQQMRLEKLKLENCVISKPIANTSSTLPEMYYGKRLKSLEIIATSCCSIVEFFEKNPNCIRNVEIINFRRLKSVNTMVKFIASNLPNIKIIQFIQCAMDLLPDTLADLNRLISLKKIEISVCFMNSYVLQHLLKCIGLKYLVVHSSRNSLFRDVLLKNPQNVSKTLKVVSIGFSCFIRNKNMWHAFLQNNSGMQLHVHYNGMQTLKEITSNHQTMQHIKRIHCNEIIVCPEILRNLSVPVVRADLNTTNFTCHKMVGLGEWCSEAVIIQT